MTPAIPLRHALGATALLALACAPALALDQRLQTEGGEIRVTTFAAGLEHPWGIDFLPDGRMIVTERPGRVRLVGTDGALSQPIGGVPEVDARDQGGLLDVTLHPDFAGNRLVYLSYAEAGGDGVNSTAVARGRLSDDDSRLEEVEVIFSQEPKLPSTKHFGSRIVFDGQGHVFITTGERSEARFRDQSQDLNSHLGKVIRLNEDGSVPDDNPFVGRGDARPEIWSYGHRNMQGAAIHPETAELWVSDHGPRGGDKIAVARAGANHGWPIISYGVNYDGSPVGIGKSEAEGMEDPVHTWNPSIATAGIAFYQGDALPGWRGDLLVTGLRANSLHRLTLDGGEVVGEERLLQSLGQRLRDVAVGPDGAVYVATDESDGRILRIGAGG